MKLSAYLKLHGIKRGEFAGRIGVSNGRVTQLCDGGWPSLDLAERIAAATDGAVSADDFLRTEEETRA